VVNKKKRGRGRPATGKDPSITVRVPKEVIDKIERWADHHTDGERSEAIRRLLELGLKAKVK
jgi:Arc/MetJ-type ribon-helix-helix transcriptional regulator